MKKMKKLLVKVLAAALIVGSVVNVPTTKAQAAVKNYYFNAYQDEAVSSIKSGDPIKDGTYGQGKKFTFTGSMNRAMSSSPSVEIAAKSGQSISFTVDKYGLAVVRVAAGSEENESVFALCNANHMPVAPEGSKDGLIKIIGTITETYVFTNLVAGTYYLENMGDAGSIRVAAVSVTQSDSLDDIAEVYTLDPATEDALSKLSAGDAVKTGKYGPSKFFSFNDDSDYSSSYITKRANSTQPSLEIAKKGGSSISFTVKAGASITILASSTGSSNTSDIAVSFVENDGKLTKVAAEGYGTDIVSPEGKEASVITYTGLKAGTYKLTCPTDGSNTGRGARIYLVTVAQPGKAATPTTIPTPTPTTVPTAEPTGEPTATPTEGASVTPETTPADTPSPVPTDAASVTPVPTAPATSAPTSAPAITDDPGDTAPSGIGMKEMLPVIGLVAGIVLVGVAIIAVVIIMDKKARSNNRKSYK